MPTVLLESDARCTLQLKLSMNVATTADGASRTDVRATVLTAGWPWPNIGTVTDMTEASRALAGAAPDPHKHRAGVQLHLLHPGHSQCGGWPAERPERVKDTTLATAFIKYHITEPSLQHSAHVPHIIYNQHRQLTNAVALRNGADNRGLRVLQSSSMFLDDSRM